MLCCYNSLKKIIAKIQWCNKHSPTTEPSFMIMWQRAVETSGTAQVPYCPLGACWLPGNLSGLLGETKRGWNFHSSTTECLRITLLSSDWGSHDSFYRTNFQAGLRSMCWNVGSWKDCLGHELCAQTRACHLILFNLAQNYSDIRAWEISDFFKQGIHNETKQSKMIILAGIFSFR